LSAKNGPRLISSRTSNREKRMNKEQAFKRFTQGSDQKDFWVFLVTCDGTEIRIATSGTYATCMGGAVDVMTMLQEAGCPIDQIKIEKIEGREAVRFIKAFTHPST
jgi:hypothetical protein